MTHPIRNAEIHTFERHDTNDGGANWVAQFYPYGILDRVFRGKTEAEVIDSAEGFRLWFVFMNGETARVEI